MIIPLFDNISFLLVLYNMYRLLKNWKVMLGNKDIITFPVLTLPTPNNGLIIMFLRLIVTYFNLLRSPQQFNRIRLIQPHVLMRLMHGYRFVLQYEFLSVSYHYLQAG